MSMICHTSQLKKFGICIKIYEELWVYSVLRFRFSLKRYINHSAFHGLAKDYTKISNGDL